ncbi:hypothetical protein ACH414_07525 [Streptomyces sp. NPDC020422]|uniref:hypothetical protein n=1 Tax=unclassified Streptomyces TaxID=2593676 RepID=UPI0036F51E3E
MFSDPLFIAASITAFTLVTCCVAICVTACRIVNAALRNSRSVDRPEIIRELARIFRHLLTSWWRRK